MAATAIRRTLRYVWVIAALLVGLVVLGFGALQLLDSERGHGFLLRQLPRYALGSGLRITAGRVEGSLFGRARIHELALADQQGVFLRARTVDLDWRPMTLLDKRLTIHDLTAPEVRLLRLPKFKPSTDKRLLPDFDILIGRLRIDRLVLAAPVTGVERVVALGGSADIRGGRARLDLGAVAATGGDTLRVKLDAEPDRDRFDVDARAVAPRGGVITALLGLMQPLNVTIAGDGKWSDWRGTARASLGGQPLADLALSARAGQFALNGTAAPALLVGGAGARLLGPSLAVNATALLADRKLATTLRARSAAVRIAAQGSLDFAAERFDGFTVDAGVLQPAALHPRLKGTDIRLAARLGGSFAAPLVDYVLTSPAFAFGTTGFERFRAVGIVDTTRRPLTIPVTATAERITGAGQTAAPLLTNVRAAGPLRIAGGKLVGDNIALRTDRITATAAVEVRFADGFYVATLDGRLPRYLVAGLGLTDIAAQVRAMPDRSGAGTRVTGRTRVAVTRLDNAFFTKLLQGLPTITADLDVAPDLRIAFANARLVASGLTLVGAGSQTPDQIVRFTGQGVSRTYGPLGVALVGPIEAPVVDLTLARPGLGIGLAAVAARLAPTPAGWSFDARGGSAYGAVAARGLVRSGNGPVAIDLAQATIAGLTTRGSIVQAPAGPFAGQLQLAGEGLRGTVALAAAGSVQRADVALRADQAKLPFDPVVTIGSGTLTAAVLLPDAGPSVSGQFAIAGVKRGAATLTAAKGTVSYAGGRGKVQVDASGDAGSPFTLASTVTIDPDRIVVAAQGLLDGRRLALERPAEITRAGTGWRLAPVMVITPDGRAELSGQYGDTLAVKARLDRIGLSLLQIASPNLALGGRVSGTIDFTAPPGGVLPSGTAALRVTGLTRTGLAAASLPVDIAVNAAMSGGTASARATIVRGGVIEGRVQAQLRDIPGTRADRLGERLLAAPLFAQARYNGPAQALWPLAGIEAADVRGPVQIAADIGGHLGDPRITGTIRSSGARFEAATLGTVVDNIQLASRFTESRLDLGSFAGTIGRDGKISGTGGIDLSSERGFPMDIQLTLANAQALNRDDLRATLTGPLRIKSGPDGARISGKLTVERGRLRIGKPAVEDVVVLDVREKNAALLGRRTQRVVAPTKWLLDVALNAPGRLEVTGMGIASEWRGDIRVSGPATQPRLTGRVELVRGDYDFAGKRFELTRGDLRFSGAYPPDPVIDVVAENTSSGFTAQLAINGTAQRPDIKFSSTPALPEDEVLSRVLFGSSITSLSAPEALQLAGALASLRGGSSGKLNPLNIVRKGLGIDRLRILPADTVKGRKTSVAAGQYIGRRVYVELATDAQGYTASNIEVSLTRSLSILSEVATLGGTSVNLRWKRDY